MAEFGFPGPTRDRLVAAILAGEKTATTSLLIEYERESEPLPEVGDRQAIIDSEGVVVATIEITRVDILPLGSVPLAHAVAEGEGCRTVEEWRAQHDAFWSSTEFLDGLGAPWPIIDDHAVAVLERFAVVARV
ncbi:ASCH domain-containing protein [Leifsonia sp. ZF2019]|nr:ASCH domain-containing protein [Leifsonia sp. ZF2019]